MKISWKYEGKSPIKLKTFIRNQGISRHLMARVREDGGAILINGSRNRYIDQIQSQTDVTIIFPPEKNRKQAIIPSYVPLKILYEDRDFLIIDKPDHVNSIPSVPQRKDSLVNRVEGYYQLRGYHDIIPHIVTRLDRDTSGIALFAKHRYAHALLSQQMDQHTVKKTYCAFLSGNLKKDHMLIDRPIGRVPGSLIERQVVEKGGQEAQTELWVKKRFNDCTVCDVRLHTGRTHQIRVHCKSIGFPLVSDTLYGGIIQLPLQRQGLHCRKIEFYHPFKNQMMSFESPLPQDMRAYLKIEEQKKGHDVES